LIPTPGFFYWPDLSHCLRLGGAAAADRGRQFLFCEFRFGANEMMMMRPLRRRRWTAISYGVIDNRSENLQH